MIIKDAKAYVKGVFSSKKTGITAGADSDNAEVTGATLDLKALKYPQGGKLVILYNTTLTADKTAAMTVKYQTSADGTNWDTAVTLMDAVVLATGETTAASGLYEVNIPIEKMKAYCRFNTTMDLNASGTDTAEYYAMVDLTGQMEIPA